MNSKICTSIEQSKKLMELGIDMNTADMMWTALNWQETEYYMEVKNKGFDMPKKYIPCWSLAALYALLPEKTDISKAYSDDCVTMVYWCWTVMSESEDECGTITETNNYDNPIDACVEMILKLNELKML